MKREQSIEALRKVYGSHSQAARVLGITPQHWRFLRAQEQWPRRMERHVWLEALYAKGRVNAR